MSDSQPPQDPYGQPPQDPYGRPPQEPYGQPPQNPYGQAPYGQASYQQPPRDPSRRPGTVTAAAITTMVMAGLTALLFGLVGLMLAVMGGDFMDTMREADPEVDRSLREAGVSVDTITGVAVALMLGLALWSLVAVVLAAFAMRRSQVARILLVVSAAMTALLSLLAITSLVSVVPLLAAIAVIVLLFTGGANEWYGRRP